MGLEVFSSLSPGLVDRWPERDPVDVNDRPRIEALEGRVLLSADPAQRGVNADLLHNHQGSGQITAEAYLSEDLSCEQEDHDQILVGSSGSNGKGAVFTDQKIFLDLDGAEDVSYRGRVTVA